MKMKAVRYYAPNDIRYEETRIPELQEGEILVKVEAALTCGTDVKTFIAPINAFFIHSVILSKNVNAEF